MRSARMLCAVIQSGLQKQKLMLRKYTRSHCQSLCYCHRSSRNENENTHDCQDEKLRQNRQRSLEIPIVVIALFVCLYERQEILDRCVNSAS